MDENEPGNKRLLNVAFDEDSRSAVNSLILDYYQKFGRKRDLEQFFALSTAQSDIRDPSSLFWRKMKVQSDSSDSGEGKAGSSTELCRISIKCTLPEDSSSQDDNLQSKVDSASPPIITEEPESSIQTDRGSPSQSDNNESIKSDGNNSQKSTEAHLDTSINKPFSPTSSITSQRKLEWDSLGDVGYGNESERKISGSNLSTLERLALHQQYSNNDSKHDTHFGPPTSQSTPVEPNISQKGKKGYLKKTTKLHKKDVDLVELKVPHTVENTRLINVNLTKHISFNVDKNGDFTVKNLKEDTKLALDKVSVETEMTPQVRMDKEIQTNLTQSKSNVDKSTNPMKIPKNQHVCEQKFPIILNLNTLKKLKRRKKLRNFKKKLYKQKYNLTNVPQVKSVNQISDAESFEYMPGYIYNQNQKNTSNRKDTNSVGNKSSLESSMVFTTDSSKVTQNSFYKDLEKSINLLKDTLHPKYSNAKLKEKLIKEVVQRLLKAKYSDDDSGNIFLPGTSFNRKISVPQNNHTTTSTSDGNNFNNSEIVKRPKKSILRIDKFNPNGMASTSQSTPNLHSFAHNEEHVNMCKTTTTTTTNTESDFSSRSRNSSGSVPKISSSELYKKYLDALKWEQTHKTLLKDKERLLKQKLVSSDTCIKAIPEKHEKSSKDRLYRLIKDLAQNNVDNGSGDASKVEGSPNSDQDLYSSVRTQRNHSVFTLSSGKSVPHSKHGSPKKCQNGKKGNSEASSSKTTDNCSVCSQRMDYAKLAECTLNNLGNKEGLGLQKYNYVEQNGENNSDFTKDFVKSNKSSPRVTDKVEDKMKDIQYVCLCSKETGDAKDVPEKLLIYKCSRINQKDVCLDSLSKASSSIGIQCSSECVCTKRGKEIKSPITTLSGPGCSSSTNKELLHKQCSTTVIYPSRKASTSSQTHANLDLILQKECCGNSESIFTSKITCQPVIAKNYSKSNNHGEYNTSGCNSRICDKTQSIQTKICIDPKISNPSISDVKFIDDLNFVKIFDGYKSNTSTIEKASDDSHGDSMKQQLSTCNNIKTVSDVQQHLTETYVKRSDVINNKLTENFNPQIPNQNKFSIPIHGTNMTLIVSLGSNTENTSDARNVITDANCLATTKINTLNKKEERKEDSTKGVQCTNTDFSSVINKKKDISNINEDTKQLHEDQCTNICSVDSKYNTYPTKSQTTKKSFSRSNTCTGCLKSTCANVYTDKKLDVEIQKDFPIELASKSKEAIDYDSSQKSVSDNNICKINNILINDQENDLKTSSTESKGDIENASKDPILKIIQDITKRYTKNDIEKSKRKKCYREIITVLNYLLDTEDSSDQKEGCSSSYNTDGTSLTNHSNEKKSASAKKIYVDKAVQLTMKKDKKHKPFTESSCLPSSSEKPETTDSGTCKVLNKIKKECEKYHQKRCKTQCEHKKCDGSSSTSVNCDNCNRVHYCSFRSKYKSNKTKLNIDKGKKNCVAYNLIIQTSDSVTSEGTVANEGCGRPLKNVIVKVPSKHEHLSNAPFKEVSAKIEKKMPNYSPCCEGKAHRSKSLPNDSERSSDDFSKTVRTCTVRDYLEMNRPDFIEETMKRQNCLKVIKQTRPDDVCGNSGVKMIVVHTPQCIHTCADPCNFYCAGAPIYCNPCVNPFIQSFNGEVTGIGEFIVTKERTAKRRLLSQQLERQQTLINLNSQDLQDFAKELSAQLRRKKVAPKFISEREMKKHSEKIYKSLPEVIQKKEQLKKENIKKTNLLMANIFKKNLQMKTLRGTINLSNYSTVVKI